MKVKQLSITLANRPSSIAQITDLLAENCINIRALSLTGSTADAGVLRLIVNDADKAKKLFIETGFSVDIAEVLVIEVPDKPGGLASILNTIRDLALRVDYMNAFSQKTGESGLIIFRLNAADLGTAAEALEKAGVRLLSSEELHAR